MGTLEFVDTKFMYSFNFYIRYIKVSIIAKTYINSMHILDSWNFDNLFSLTIF
jgi:hypothetical protein